MVKVTVAVKYAVFVIFDGTKYRYTNPTSGQNAWSETRARRLVKDCTHPPRQTAYMERIRG